MLIKITLNMQANAILICMKCYIYGTRFKYICVSIITRICERAKGGGRGGGAGMIYTVLRILVLGALK